MIGILGYYGHGSRGDDLLQYAMAQLFGETYAFSISSRFSPQVIPLEKVNEMDALVIGGGTLLGNALPYPLCDSEWIEGVQVPLYVFGAGAKWPHEDGVLQEGRLATQLLVAHQVLKSKSRFFGVRGPLTQEILGREGISSEIVGDPVMALAPEGGPDPTNIWLVNFRQPQWFGRADYEETARELVAMLATVVPIEGLAFDEADATFLRSLGMDVVVPDLTGLSTAMQACAGVVAMRLHANVLAAVCGKPFLHLGYELKSWDFQRTVAPTKPIDFVPEAPSAHAIMSEWHLLGVETSRRVFLDSVQEQVTHWRGVLAQKAKMILGDL